MRGKLRNSAILCLILLLLIKMLGFANWPSFYDRLWCCCLSFATSTLFSLGIPSNVSSTSKTRGPETESWGSRYSAMPRPITASSNRTEKNIRTWRASGKIPTMPDRTPLTIVRICRTRSETFFPSRSWKWKFLFPRTYYRRSRWKRPIMRTVHSQTIASESKHTVCYYIGDIFGLMMC